MSPKELRKELRIPRERLAPAYHKLTVLLYEEEHEVVMTDASLSGFGFLSTKTASEFVVGTRIVICPLGKNDPVYGKIVNVGTLPSGLTRVGLQLLPTGGYETYRQEIERLLQEASNEPRS